MNRLFDLAVGLDDLMSARLTRHGLTPARAEVLWLLHRRGAATQRALSEILNCTPRNVYGLVDVLQESGFMDRVPHPADRRAVQVSLSAKGRKLLADWDAERIHRTPQILAGLSIAELSDFTAVLDRVLFN